MTDSLPPLPPLPAPWPDGPTITVPLSACCGALPGDVCDCAQQWSELLHAFAAPLHWTADADTIGVSR